MAAFKSDHHALANAGVNAIDARAPALISVPAGLVGFVEGHTCIGGDLHRPTVDGDVFVVGVGALTRDWKC